MAILEVDGQVHFTGDLDLDNKIIATSSATTISNWSVGKYYKTFLQALDKYPEKVESVQVVVNDSKLISKLINLKYNYYECAKEKGEEVVR